MSNLINQQKDSAETLSKMIDLLGLSAEQQCNFDDRCIVLNLRSEDPGRLIGRNGQTIDALQTLINKMLRRHEDDFPRIVIDVDGYKKTRRTRRNRKESDSNEPNDDGAIEVNERPKRERPKRRERHDNNDESRKPKARQERQNEPKSESTSEPRQPRKHERKSERNNEPRQERQERKPEPRQERQERKPEPRQERNHDRKPERRENNNRPEGGRSKLSDDRTEAIKKQAIEASKEAKRWGEKVTLPPMSSSERRLIHLTLQDDPAIVTESGADMPNGKKRVIVRSK